MSAPAGRTARARFTKQGVGLALLLSAFSGACGTTKAACPATPIVDPRQALVRQQQEKQGLRSLRAEARVDQRGREGRIKGRVMMFVERPDRVRFDAVTQFGPALTLTSDGDDFALSDFKDNRFLTGPACQRNIARMIGVALSGSDVASVLLGESPLLEANQESIECRDGSYVIERKAQDGSRQELEHTVYAQDLKKAPEEQRLRLVRASVWDAQGKPMFRVRYEDYAPTGAGVELPKTVRIDDYVNDADALLRFSSLDVNVNVPPDAFTQTPRAGLSVEQIGCE